MFEQLEDVSVQMRLFQEAFDPVVLKMSGIVVTWSAYLLVLHVYRTAKLGKSFHNLILSTRRSPVKGSSIF